MLQKLDIANVGPSPHMSLEFAERLNLFTGDNGVGKTFLLEVAWFALTGGWVKEQALPSNDRQASINYRCVSGDEAGTSTKVFYASDFGWSHGDVLPHNDSTSIVCFAQVDDGFAVWDPARHPRADKWIRNADQDRYPSRLNFTQTTLWRGLTENGIWRCNGLLRDWATWQLQSKAGEKQLPFSSLKSALEALSPDSDERLLPDEPVRISPNDVQLVPTIRMPYGPVPITHASAGVQRIVSLAYLLTWTWHEHLEVCRLTGRAATNQMVLLIDEVEAHLHPRWQRTILPSILNVAKVLAPELKLQVLATTHSPLVMASIETAFDESRDALFTFEINEQNSVEVHQTPWAKQGDVVNWLVSEAFGLKQARSKEAETAIEAAEAYMRGDLTELPAGLATQAEIHKRLQQVLPGHDDFWPRWIVRRNGQPA